MDKDLHLGPYEIVDICPETGTVRFVVELIWPENLLPLIDGFGWGNGYVALPVGNPFFGYHYEELNSILVELPETLTYSAMGFDAMPECVHGLWVVGFDTGHYWNKRGLHTREWVIKSTQELKRLLIK